MGDFTYPLHDACQRGDLHALRIHLQQGIRDCRNSQDLMAFDIACLQGDAAAAALLLLSNDSELLCTDVLKEALENAVEDGHSLLAKLLVRFGADMSVVNTVCTLH